MKRVLLGCLVAVAMLAGACEKGGRAPETLRVGFAPWENPQDLAKTAQPILELLSKATGKRAQSFVASDYAGVIEALRAKKLDVAFLPPAAYVLAEKNAGAKVILKSLFHDRAMYYSAIITRKDTGIRTLGDLKGKSFAFVDPNSTSGAIYPKVMLMNAGLDPSKDLKQVIYAGGHDAVVLAVLNKKVDAGAVYANDPTGADSAWASVLKGDPRLAEILMIAQSKPIPSDNIAVASDLHPTLVTQIKQAFLDLSSTPEGRKRIREIYHVDGFAEAQASDYEPVREAFEKVGLKL